MKIQSFKILIAFLFVFFQISLNGQGFNHQWLLGYTGAPSPQCRIYFDTSSFQLQLEQRKMGFDAAEGNICDPNGNLLMSSNGLWIANANNDTMLNGNDLNANSGLSSSNPRGSPMTYSNLILPYPDDSLKYVLFHHSFYNNGQTLDAYAIMQTIIDMRLDGGAGGVTIKNDTILSDTLNWGFGACKHANGRDWWIVVQKESSDVIFKFLLTPNGIQSLTSQALNVPIAYSNTSHLDFSPDGNKFSYSIYDSITHNETVLLFDFDRCKGMFTNPVLIPITLGHYLFGLTFSSNSQYVYVCSSGLVLQIDLNSNSFDTVAVFDGFASPSPPFYTIFNDMYRAANGKIYITTGNSTDYLHVINYPDSLGMACDVQQHSLFLNSYNFRTVPNHPNYYLGSVIGSACDTLAHVGLQQHEDEIQIFKLSPNPTKDGLIKIIYLLPQNKQGIFEVYDLNGKIVFTQTLSPWSSLQYFNLSFLENGLYECVIRAEKSISTRKLVISN